METKRSLRPGGTLRGTCQMALCDSRILPSKVDVVGEEHGQHLSFSFWKRYS